MDLTSSNPDRHVLFPIQHPKVWNMYKKAVASFWTAEEIDLSYDRKDFEKLNEGKKRFIKHVLSFFAASDGIVLENLAQRFCNDIQIPEVRCFYGFQIAMENIHSEVYSLLIDTLVKDNKEKKKCFKSSHFNKTIKAKANWCQKWIESSQSFATRLLAFACVEGIFFSASFCCIFWIKNRKGILPGLCKSNEFISRDEGLHCEFACLLYNEKLPTSSRLSEEKAHEIVKEAVETEKQFVNEALQKPLLGINKDTMSQYVEYVADFWMQRLRYKSIYNSKNPFDFMNTISLQEKTNFFENRVSEYQKLGVYAGGTNNIDDAFVDGVDF